MSPYCSERYETTYEFDFVCLEMYKDAYHDGVVEVEVQECHHLTLCRLEESMPDVPANTKQKKLS